MATPFYGSPNAFTNASAVVVLPASGGGVVNPLAGSLFTVTPTANETFTAAASAPGSEVTIVVTTSGSTSYTLTFGTGFKTTGTLATGTTTAKVFTIQFISDGVNLNEVGRTTAM